VLKLVLKKRRCIKQKRQMDQCDSPFLTVTPRWPVKITKNLPQTRNVPSSFDNQVPRNVTENYLIGV